MRVMGKSGKVLAVVGAAVLMGGFTAACGSSGGGDSASGTVVEDAVTADGVAEDGAGADDSIGEKNRKLLEGAMGGKDSVVCEFSEAGVDGKMIIQGEAFFRFEGISEDGPIQMVREGDNLYMWAPDTTVGLKMDVSTAGEGEQVVSPLDLQDEAAVNNLKCEKYTGDMGLLRAPADVEFASLEDMLSSSVDPETLEGLLNGNSGAGSGN